MRGGANALTVDLGRPVPVGAVRPVWRTRPASADAEVSADGRAWRVPDGGAVRYVRVSVRGRTAALAELSVRR